MAIDPEEFICLYDLLAGSARLPKGKDEAEAPAPKQWEPSVLARVIRQRGIMGWTALNHEGDFEKGSPEAQEALDALDEYQARLEKAAYDPQVMAAAERNLDTRRDCIEGVYDPAYGGPLFRYGWDREGLPPLARLEADEKVQDLSAKEQHNDRKLIGMLVEMLLETRGAGRRRSSSINPAADLARDVDAWAALHKIKGLGVATVRKKFGEAREALERAKRNAARDPQP